MSSASISSSSRVSDGSPRRARAARICAGAARNDFRSITKRLAAWLAWLEPAKAAISIDEDLEVDAVRHRIDSENMELAVEDERGRGGNAAVAGTRMDDRDRSAIDHDRAIALVL